MQAFFYTLLLWCFTCTPNAVYPIPRYAESVYNIINVNAKKELIGTIYVGDGRWYPVYTLLTLEA